MSKQVQLPAGRCLRYEIALNGWRILKDTINDFSLAADRVPLVYRGARPAPRRPGAGHRHRHGDVPADAGPRGRQHGRARGWTPNGCAGSSRKSLEAARPGDGTIYAVVADATALPISDGAGRRVSAISSLEHIPDDEAVGREIGACWPTTAWR